MTRKFFLMLLAISGMVFGICQLVMGNDKLFLMQNGKVDYVIVEANQPTDAEAFAATELADFIKRSTGAEIPILKESDFKGGHSAGSHAIYIGRTDFARNQKIDFKSLGNEEWIIRAVNGNLLISGGRPRGTLYGVYEFLEKFIGVRFLDANTEFVPNKTELVIPSALAIQESPAFIRREIFMTVPSFEKFNVRLKINSFKCGVGSVYPKFGFSLQFGSPYSTHTHHFYSKDFPADKPEYFAMRANGTRGGQGAEGQVCMSNPEVRKFFAAKLREYIKQDREKIVKSGNGEPFPLYYALVPNDNTNKCVCVNCLALSEKYGAYSGGLLEFTNFIAEDIAKDYPDVLIVQGAYTFYADAPSGIKPRDNVVIGIAQLGTEFNTIPKRDTLRSMEHPLNGKARQMWEDWSKVSKNLGVHDYWTAWSQPFQWPQTNIHGLAQTLRFYHRSGLRHFFVEDELFGSRLHNFVDLQYYMATKLLQNPNQDEQPIIDEFLELYYDKAAPEMKKLLGYIERRQEEEKAMLASVPPSTRKYFDAKFFIETNAILDEAEKLVSADPKKFMNVRQERLPIDETMLYLWNELKTERDLPFSREKVIDRLEKNYKAAYVKYGSAWGHEEADKARLRYLRNMPPVPEQFKGKKIIDLCGPMGNFDGGGGFAHRTDDPDATCGKAWTLDSTTKKSMVRHDIPPEFGLSDCVSDPKFLTRQVIARKNIPVDGKFHLYLAGRMKATPNMYFWAHSSWRLSTQLLSAYNSSLPDQKTYDVYASIKLVGPSYVSGSTGTNAFSVDRLILVEVETPLN